MSKIRICSIRQEFYDLFNDNVELEKNDKRPCLIVLKLKYKNNKYDFAIPFRSNIYGGAKRNEYFPLPPRKTTKKGKKHGLHYTKMFPINKKYINAYYSENKENMNDIIKIRKNFNQIIDEAQKYLESYKNGIRYSYCVNIDAVLAGILNESQKIQEVATEINKENI